MRLGAIAALALAFALCVNAVEIQAGLQASTLTESDSSFEARVDAVSAALDRVSAQYDAVMRIKNAADAGRIEVVGDINAAVAAAMDHFRKIQASMQRIATIQEYREMVAHRRASDQFSQPIPRVASISSASPQVSFAFDSTFDLEGFIKANFPQVIASSKLSRRPASFHKSVSSARKNDPSSIAAAPSSDYKSRLPGAAGSFDDPALLGLGLPSHHAHEALNNHGSIDHHAFGTPMTDPQALIEQKSDARAKTNAQASARSKVSASTVAKSAIAPQSAEEELVPAQAEYDRLMDSRADAAIIAVERLMAQPMPASTFAPITPAYDGHTPTFGSKRPTLSLIEQRTRIAPIPSLSGAKSGEFHWPNLEYSGPNKEPLATPAPAAAAELVEMSPMNPNVQLRNAQAAAEDALEVRADAAVRTVDRLLGANQAAWKPHAMKAQA